MCNLIYDLCELLYSYIIIINVDTIFSSYVKIATLKVYDVQVLRRGANVNDRDGLTDLSLLHFACKSGAAGVGNVNAAVNLVITLLNKVYVHVDQFPAVFGINRSSDAIGEGVK